MEYLNIPLAVVAGIEFIGSPPLARATWLSLQIFCTKSENGGRIANCSEWGDHTWGQIAGLKRREVHTPSLLWRWDGPDLIVWAYNTESEEKVKLLRARGRRGGWLSGQSRRSSAALPHGEADGEPSASPNGEADASSQSDGLLERKGKERKEKESKSLSLPPAKLADGTCTIAAALAYAQSYNAGQGLAAGRRIENHVATLWHDDREKVGWVTSTGVPIVDWQADLRGYAQRYTQNEHRPVRGSPISRQPIKLSTEPKGGF